MRVFCWERYYQSKMIKSILDITEGITCTIVKLFRDEIRREIEENAKIIQDGIANGIKEGVDYTKSELTHISLVLFTLLLGSVFIMYGASVYLDNFFANKGIGFLLVGAISVMFSLILIVKR